MIRKKKNRAARGERLDRGRRQPSIYSRTEQNAEKRDFKKGFLIVLLIFLVVGMIYLVILSPVFSINKVTIDGTKYVSKNLVAETVKDYMSNDLLKKNSITLPAGGLAKRIMDLPGIKDAKVIKKYPNGIVVQVEERTPVLIWQVLNDKYLVDESGIIYAKYNDQFKDTPVVVDTNNIPTAVGKQPVSGGFSSFVKYINDNFTAITNLKISQIEVINTTDELKVYTSAWYAYFDTTRPANDELGNLARVLDEVRSKGENLEYIDLRIENKVFYMLK